MGRRKHTKIDTLPPELRDLINEKIVEGCTYDDVANCIRSMGHDVSRSSVGRYGKDFLAKLEKLRVVKEQAKAIIEDSKDAPALEMTEAANQMAMQIILERLMKMDDLGKAKSTEVLKALALLERSAVQREKLKFDFNKGVNAAADRIIAQLQGELEKQPELFALITAAVETAVADARQR